MRFRLTAKVEADAKSVGPFSVAVDDLRAGIVTNDQGEVRDVWVEVPVQLGSGSLPVVTRPPGEPMHVDFREPPEADRLLAILQYLESMGAFWLSINRIHWGAAKHEWIPESAEEERQLSMFSLEWRSDYPRTPIQFRADLFHDIFARHAEKSWLTIPLSFYREGRNDYRAHRYINAFFSFYFILEDLFGGGKTQNRHVLQQFQSSVPLKHAAQVAYQQCDMAGKEVRPKLRALMNRIGGGESPEGVLQFLVAVRGELHHFSRKSSRPKGHPLNQREFHPVAWLTMAICLELLPSIVTEGPDPHGHDVQAT